MSPLSVGFIDLIDWDYDPNTPYERALGGAQSNLCFLAEHLAGQGVEVVLFNNASSPGVVRSVRVHPLTHNVTPDALSAPDVLIVLNTVESALSIRGQAPNVKKLFWWGGHHHEEPGVQGFHDPQLRDAWDGFIFKTRWQRDQFIAKFGLDPHRCHVMRNAISPDFAERLTAADTRDPSAMQPTMAYTSTPFRGLDVLLDTMPRILDAQPDAQLRVFSSLKVYQHDEGGDQFGALYDKCRATPGVDYVGSLAKADLATQLASCDILAYPCTFQETAPSAVLEAMAAGCHVVTTDAYCLPELTAGFATLVPFGASRDELVAAFSAAIIDVTNRARRDPGGFKLRLDQQLDHMRTQYQWPHRAAEWIDWLGTARR